MKQQHKRITTGGLYSFLIFLILILPACNSQKSEIEFALKQAGENRGELEAVLSHYTKLNDTLKLKAAQYLIQYMPYHYSYGTGIRDYYHAIDSVVALSDDKLEQEKHIKSLQMSFENRYRKYRDIEVITADFLIQSIDAAFKQWQQGKWAAHLNFEEFCEYLLPYKCFEGQPLEEWRSACYDLCKGDIDMAYLCDDYEQSSFFAAMEVNRRMKEVTPQSFGRLTTLPIYDPAIILKLPYAYCSTYCQGSVINMRSKGIPVAYDFTPHWSNRAKGHSWNTVYTSRFGNLEFAPNETDPGTVHYPFLKMPKIFRTVYKPNDEYLEIASRKYIPTEIKNMFIRDVTAEYMPTLDIQIKLKKALSDKQHPFIAVYDCEDWSPVYWGKVSGRNVTFERMGLNTYYMAFAYDRNGYRYPICEPFEVTPSKQIKFMELDTSSFRTIRMNRKFPQGDNIFSIHEQISGGLFEAADNPDFHHARKMQELPRWNLTNGSFSLPTEKAYRYWRFSSSDTSHCDMAEVYFYDAQDSIIRGNVMDYGSEQPDEEWKAENISDGDQLSNFRAKGALSWVGFDFGKPVDISRISYIRRGDGNSIQPGLTYSLYYWDTDQWKCIGTKTATDVFVDFEHAPRKALFAIKCSEGEEQRIFTCDENNKISWY